MFNKQPASKQYLLAALFLCCFLLTGQTVPASQDEQLEESIALLERSSRAFSSVVKKAGPAVVYIGIEKTDNRFSGIGGEQTPYDFFNDPFFEHFFGKTPGQRTQPKHFKEHGAGSGFIISADGLILTNNHVVDGADSIKVRLADEREFMATVVGTDPQSDVALIRIKGKNLPFLNLGDSDKLEVGEWVIAIGSPFELSQTVTVGVVSAKGRSRMGINDYENFIQTDAAINPGNSGGPLLDIYGKVIGINTAIFSRSGGYMGIGFAIPVNMAKSIEKQLRQNGRVSRGWLGVMIQDVDENLAASFKLNKAEGILISEVTANSPADKAGFKRGDVILAQDGIRLSNVSDLRNRVAMTMPGSKVFFTLIRNGREKKIKVKIQEQPSELSRTKKIKRKQGTSLLSRMGLSLQELTQELARQFGYQQGQGVIIADVADDSPAARVGLQAGQLIEEVNRVRIHSMDELTREVKRTGKTHQVLLRVRAGEYSRYVVLRTE